jgi:low affinity Fe/Cu permease
VERSEAAETRQSGEHMSLFERFVEVTHHRVSRAPFFALCAALVVVWFASFPLWPSLKEWQVAIHTVGSVFSLLLLVLLENAGRRADEASQEKLNVIAEGLAALMESRAEDDRDLVEATQQLRDAVGLEERH